MRKPHEVLGVPEKSDSATVSSLATNKWMNDRLIKFLIEQ